ncbi:MAG: LysR family transcriptional regulator [Clostridiales bacterium]|nr:LysR family transcriptional regulator [Clostridiales bacterium]
MNDLAIEYFLCVARNGSFSKAARELFVSQPAISRQISSLEKELGFTLFDRTNKETKLTEIGELFYRFFSEYKEGFSRTLQQAREINLRQNGRVTLGCLSGWDLSGFLPKLIARFKERYPNIALTVEGHDFQDLASALLSGDLDIALSIESSLRPVRDLRVQPLVKIPMLILYSSNHPLAEKPGLSPEDFEDEVFLVPTDKEISAAINTVRASLAPYRFEPKIRVVPNIESMLSGVHNGLGVAVSDVWSRELSNEDFRHIPLSSAHTVCLAWYEKNKNPAIPAVVNDITMLFSQEDKPDAV